MVTVTDTPATYPGYTNLGLEEGVFDRLMLASHAHIHDEYSQGRITKETYGTVYLGLLESAMQASTQYLLGVLLIDEKKRAQDLANQKLEYELENILPLEEELRRAQINKINAEISLMAKEEEKIDKELLVMDKQIQKMDAEISLMAEQELKIQKEIAFLDAKIQTERANTEAGIAATGSLIGKQISLLTAQRMGFAGDVYAKMAKLEADYASVFQSVQEIETADVLNTTAAGRMTTANTVASSIMALT